MRKYLSSVSFAKKVVAAFFSIQIALSISICPAFAEKWTTYLAPQYENVPLNPENAYLSVAPAADPASSSGQAMTLDITNPFEQLEVSSKKATKVTLFPGYGEYAKDVIPALVKSPEMLDSAKLRMIARKIKHDLIVKSGNASYAEFYKQYVTSPIAFLIGFTGGSGPRCIIEPLYLILTNGSYYFFNSEIFIEDHPGLKFSVIDAIKNDTLDLVVAHENAHGMMFDMYGSQAEGFIKSSHSTIGHDGPVISDRVLAYMEGWAEAFEALYGPTNPLLKLKEEEREKYRISEFLFTRQDPVRRNRYIWQTYKGKKNGLLKNGLQLISTEGVIAGQFYDLLTSKKLKEPFIKSITVMYNHRPKDYIEFIKGWIKDNPEDKQTVYRIFLENTNYATVSNKARSLYYDYYQAKLKYVKKEMDEKTFYEIKNKWLIFKEDLFKTVMQNDNIDANIGADLWMNLATTAAPGIKDFHFNISSAPQKAFGAIKGLTPEDAAAIFKAREAMGTLPYKTATEALINMLGEEKANIIISENGITNL